jgi:hypothetical protein
MNLVLNDIISLNNFLLCEDVREEINRKHTLVGVYSGGILVAKFPANIRLAAFLELSFQTDGKHILFLRMRYKEREIAQLEAEITVGTAGVGILALQSFNLNALEAGNFEIDVSANKETWMLAIKKSISVGEIPSLR